MPISLHLTTLGRLELTGEGGAPLLAGRRKLLVVLAYLARCGERRVARARLADLFWPVEDEERARRSVRQALAELRRAAGDALREEGDAVGLDLAALEVDASRLERCAAADDCGRALTLWGGDFLAGAEDVGGEDFRAWLEAERELLRRRFARAAERAVERSTALGDAEAALAAAERWVAAFPLDERAQLRLVQALRLAGRSTEAHDRHAAFASRLRSELGVEPSAAFLSAAPPVMEVRREAASARSAPSASLLGPELVGRGPVLAELCAAWEDVVGGGARAVLIEGDEGLGKSRLCAEVVRWVRARTPGAVVLQARAYEAEAGRTWMLARHLLAPLADAPGVAAAAPEVLAALSELVPGLRARLRGLPPVASPLTSAALRAGEMTRQVLAEVTVDAPVLIVVDDLHHADPASAALIGSLLRRTPPRTLAVLTSLAAGAARLPSAVRPALGLARRLALSSLSAADVETLVASMLDLPAASRRALAHRLCVEGRGSPLYVVQAVAGLADAGLLTLGADAVWRLHLDAERDPIPLPAAVVATVGERLERLSPAARQVVDAAAVLGERMELSRLRTLTGLGAAEFDAALDEAGAHRMLAGDPGDPRVAQFSSGVILRVARASLPLGRRRALHSLVMRAVDAAADAAGA